VVESTTEAAAQVLLHEPTEPQLVLIDAIPSEPPSAAPIEELVAQITDLRDHMPQVAIVVVAPTPPPVLVISAFRAGAHDFVDLDDETDEGLLDLLARVIATIADKLEQSQHIRDLRAVVEDFLRELIRTERRSIDLEHQLEVKDKRRSELTGDLDPDREPTIVIIEDDREVSELLVDELEEVGMVTYAFLTGEDAVLEVIKMTKKGEAIDLALVDQKLPGIDGLEVIRQMRVHRPGLSVFLMTGFSDSQTAEEAADLGVVGYVLKPFDDVAGLVSRLREQAIANRDQARERHYLAQIKQRHDKVLMRYRQIAAVLEHFHD